MSSPTVKDYSLLENIGSGSYATVYKAFKKNGPREVIAMKCVDKATLSKSAIDNLITEINLLKILKHEHIVEMKDFFWDEGHIYIVMEYCNGGDLSHFIRKKHKLSENCCKKFLQQLAVALKYLRDNNVCHMDLKPQNLLLVARPKLTLKVGDFGFAQFLSPSEKNFTIRGSPLYMAPEILLRHKYDAHVDLWSVGVIMYECLFGKAPYCSNNFKELADKIKNMQPIELPKSLYISPSCKDLLLSLLQHNPSERITFDDFFAHDFLDLDHMPTTDNFDKGVALVQKAVRSDAEKNEKEAFHLYSEALRYFIPFITNEEDPQRKAALRLRVNEYIERAEKLKNTCVGVGSSVIEGVTEGDGVQGRSRQREVPFDCANYSPFHELFTLSKSTTQVAGALEIGEAADQYLAEGKYDCALEKFQSSLSVLVPLLGKEPPGRRRDLLHKQIQLWMKTAESTKGLLIAKNTDIQQAAETHEQCILQ